MDEHVRFNNNVITFNGKSEAPLITIGEDGKLKSVCIEGYRMFPVGYVLGWGELWWHVKGHIRELRKGASNGR